jgi:simple sugar transport system ATP-binding protein
VTGAGDPVAPVLELRGLSVRYGNVTALARVGATLPAGEITCVLGENGSGKSTLVAVLSGLRRHDEGQLLLDGVPVRFRSPRQARAAGIATVWQDLAVAPLMSVWRNFFLGAEPTRRVWPLRRIDVARAREVAAAAMAAVGVPGLDPDQPASALQAGERHSLAVARALHFGARVLVVDEPTAPMTVPQLTLVLRSLVEARRRGLAVLFVTNNPRYAHLVGDRYLLLAGGAVAGTLTRADVDENDLIRLLAGGEQFRHLTQALADLHPDRSGREGGVAVAQQGGAALLLVQLADRLGGAGQHGQAAQEAAVGLVRPRHRAVALPAVAAQRVQPAVVAGPRVGVGLDGRGQPAVGPVGRALGQRRPRRARPGVRRGDLDRVGAGGQRRLGLRIAGQQHRVGAAEQVASGGDHLRPPGTGRPTAGPRRPAPRARPCRPRRP